MRRMLRFVENAPSRLSLTLALGLCFGAAPLAAQVSGRVEILEKDDAKQKVIREVVVYLDGPTAAAPETLRTKRYQITSQNKSFGPRVEAVTVGATVAFPNLDPIMHNVFSLSAGNKFDLGLYKSGASRDHRFDHPGLVRVYCNIHPQMSAFVLVLASPFFTWAKPDGTFRIENVPPGTYTLRAWSEKAQAEQNLEVAREGASGVKLVLDTRRFKEQPHLNKEGKPYKREKY